jgi:4-hydroxy-2-oxovalerate/4-hydroxy-2-oxohexanoate aldolase
LSENRDRADLSPSVPTLGLLWPCQCPPIELQSQEENDAELGVYSSFLLFAKRAEAKYGVPARKILLELGRRGMVGGQEDMIEDAALTMAREREGLTLSDVRQPP